jgi:L-cysteine desulfidase
MRLRRNLSQIVIKEYKFDNEKESELTVFEDLPLQEQIKYIENIKNDYEQIQDLILGLSKALRNLGDDVNIHEELD